jgi:Fe-S-cluster containining protein
MTSIDLSAAASPEAVAALNQMLFAAQDALRLALGRAPGLWDEALEAHLERAFAAYDRYRAIVETAHPTTCRVGCTACCHDNPRGVTGVERRYLTAWVDRWEDGPALRARFRELAAQATDPESWRRKHIACPLLENGRCRAYERRPIACRAFVALSPAEWCSPESADYARRVNPHLDPPAVILQIFNALSQHLGLGGPTDLHRGLS